MVPYWRLSAFYGFYFAALGALVPYWGLYLRSLGYEEAQIGELIAVIMATKIVAPNVWGWIADHTGRRMRIVRLASFLGWVCFAGVFIGHGYGWLMLVMTAFSFFWNASLPQFEATTLNHLGKDSHRYSVIRLWGSIGFIVTVMGLGVVFDLAPIAWLPWILWGLFIGIWISSLIVPQGDRHPVAQSGLSLRAVLARREVIALLLACFLLQASHGPYYSFYSIYLEDHDYSRKLIGQLWALGVLAEIILFLFMHRLLPRIGARGLMLIALALTSVRWLMIAYGVESLAVLLLAQLLHAASFGIVHAVAIYLIHYFFPGPLQGRGQALYSSLSFGAGGALGSLYAGYMWQGSGALWVFVLAAVMSVLAFVIILWGLKTHQVQPAAPGPEGL